MKFSIIKNKAPIIGPGIKQFNPFAFDALWAYHPCIVTYKGEYFLFYTGKGTGLGINHQIGLAKSKDLNSWRKSSISPLPLGNYGEWDSDFVAHCFVFKDGDTFKMLYDGSKKGNWLESIGLAESKDLMHWKKYNNNPIFKISNNWWEKRHVSRCSVFKEKGMYYLYYAGHDDQRERIGIAKGKNLLSLKRVLKTPVLDVGGRGTWDEASISDPRVIKYKDHYLMFYSGADVKGIERIGVAESRDFIHWKKHRGNPILDVSENGWDKVSAARADIKIFDDKVYIFYSGKKNFFYSIGIATLTIS